MKPKEAHEFTVMELKTKLQEKSLPTVGTKNELIARLQAADPSGARGQEPKDSGDSILGSGTAAEH